MVYRKGEVTPRQRERDHPHLCAVVEASLRGGVIMEAHAFCRERGIRLEQGRSRGWDGVRYTTYCFDDPQIADEFAARFNGRRGTRDTFPPGILRGGVPSKRI